MVECGFEFFIESCYSIVAAAGDAIFAIMKNYSSLDGSLLVLILNFGYRLLESFLSISFSASTASFSMKSSRLLESSLDKFTVLRLFSD